MKQPVIVLVAPPGIGKSTLIPTLPKYRDFESKEPHILSFLFDTQGEQAYAHGLDRMRVVKISTNESTTIQSIKSKIQIAASANIDLGYDKYSRFAAFVNNMITTKEIKKYQWVVFDSFTFMLSAIMNELASKEGRLGQKHTLEDYGRAATILGSVIESILDLQIPLVLTAHSEKTVVLTDANGNPTKTEKNIATLGQLKTKIPAMFDNVFEIYVKAVGTKTMRMMKVQRDTSDNYVRTTLTGLKDKAVDVSIDMSKDTSTQGLAELFSKFPPADVDDSSVEVI